MGHRCLSCLSPEGKTHSSCCCLELQTKGTEGPCTSFQMPPASQDNVYGCLILGADIDYGYLLTAGYSTSKWM